MRPNGHRSTTGGPLGRGYIEPYTSMLVRIIRGGNRTQDPKHTFTLQVKMYTKQDKRLICLVTLWLVTPLHPTLYIKHLSSALSLSCCQSSKHLISSPLLSQIPFRENVQGFKGKKVKDRQERMTLPPIKICSSFPPFCVSSSCD